MLNSNDLINKVKVYNKFLNPERLDKAFNFAVKAHQNQKRASGDPYSVHPIEVANILAEPKPSKLNDYHRFTSRYNRRYLCYLRNYKK